MLVFGNWSLGLGLWSLVLIINFRNLILANLDFRSRANSGKIITT